MFFFFYFPTMYNFLSLLTSIRIKNHFPLKSPFDNFFKSSLRSPADILIPWIRENKDVSSANSLTLDDKLSDKSLIEIRNSNGPYIDPCGTSALTLVQVDT